MHRALCLLAFTVLLAAAACGSDTDDRPATFSYIHAAILVPNCATSGCHSTITKTKGVDLEQRETALVVFQNLHFDYVDIIQLMKGQVPNYYRMPPDQPLPDADIALVQRWYDEGMQDN